MVSSLWTRERHDSPVTMFAEPDRWTMPGGLDLAALRAEVDAYRAREVARVSRAVGRAISRLWRKLVSGPAARWLERERILRELSRLDDRELAELGITRGMIPFVAAGRFAARDDAQARPGQPANENDRSKKAA